MFWKAYELQEETPCHHTSVPLIYYNSLCQHSLENPANSAICSRHLWGGQGRMGKKCPTQTSDRKLMGTLYKTVTPAISPWAPQQIFGQACCMRKQGFPNYMRQRSNWTFCYFRISLALHRGKRYIYFRGAPVTVSTSSAIWKIFSPMQCLPQLITALFARQLAFWLSKHYPFSSKYRTKN